MIFKFCVLFGVDFTTFFSHLNCRFLADSPQPMYVNMHELATMAATKAQEMNFPPPPPELINIPPENQEKVSDK